MKFEAAVTDIIKRTSDIKSFRFNRPSGLEYKAGQYIIIKLIVNGNMVSKPFSISSSPTEKDHIEFTKKLTGHDFSNVLNAIRMGELVGIEGPYGKMTFEVEHERIALLCGGIGITPMISICRYCTDKHLNNPITLISSNKTQKDIIFKDELELMQHRNDHLKVVHTLTRPTDEWEGCRGRICEEIIVNNISYYKDCIFYICGPPLMVESMCSILYDLKIPDQQINIENFTGY
jgi:ferredoxin-NADP reductase